MKDPHTEALSEWGSGKPDQTRNFVPHNVLYFKQEWIKWTNEL